MKGDYYRYIAEFAQGESYNKAADNAVQAYLNSMDMASTKLKKTDPIKLSSALNLSVFYYEILGDTAKAVS
jgi:14-3-3 protein epsilon